MSSRAITGRALALALAVTGLITPSQAPAAQKAIWGPISLPNGSSAFPLYRKLGVDSFQIRLDWARTASTRPATPTDPNDPAYRWPADVDLAIKRAAANGITIALLVTSSPSWANGGRGGEWAPNEPQDYANFMTAASRRYPAVRYWMVWGEPNLEARFKPNAEDDPIAARTYAPILDAAYVALKSVSRRNIVIGGMTWSGGTVKPKPFLDAMRLPGGRPPRLDWFGHNPFPFRFPNLRELTLPGGWRDMSDVEVFSKEVRRTYRPLGRRAKLWLSEFTIQSDHASDAFQGFVSQREQARWLVGGYSVANSVHAVEALGWFTLFDQPETPSAANWGLLEPTGEAKPAYFAFRRAPSRRLRPSVRVRRRTARRVLATTGLALRVRPRASGRVIARLVSRSGKQLGRVTLRVRGGRQATLRLQRAGVRRGRYRVEVDAPRGERVRRPLQVR